MELPFCSPGLRNAMNIFISFIGAGILGLPYAFKKAGLFEGAIVMIFVACCSIKAMLLLIDCKYKVEKVLGPQRTALSSVKISKGRSYTPLKEDDEDDRSSSKSPMLNQVEIVKGGNVAFENDGSETNSASKRKNRMNSGSGSSSAGSNSNPNSIPNSLSNSPKHDNPESISSTRSNSPVVSKNTSTSYSDVAFATFGILGRYLVEASIVLSQIGFCCAYLIFITENISWRGLSKKTFLTFLLPLELLLTMIPDLKSLQGTSSIANFSNIVAFLVAFYFDLEHYHLASNEHRREFSISEFPFFFSIAIYCFEGAGMILSLEQSMPDQLRSTFKGLFIKTLTFVTTIYIMFGIAGYLSFGPDTKEIITLNLEPEGGIDFALIVKVCLCFSLFFTYPVMMFPVTKIITPKVQQLITIEETTLFRLVLRFILVSITGIIVIVIPNFANLMSFIGATCCTLLAFILPALCHLILFKNDLDKFQIFLDIFLILVGIIGSILGSYDALMHIYYPSRE